MSRILSPTPESLHLAADTLRAGRLVAFPTETVYGLGAAAENPAAVRAMFAAKGRPADHPVIVHLASARQLGEWAADVPPEAKALADAFWPGPLTMILRRRPRASDLVTGGLATVGLRVPAHAIAQELLRLVGGGVAAPSANRFGRVSPTTAEHVLAELDGLVDLILDGGPCAVGVESTIVDLSHGRPDVLRPGGVTAEQLAAVLGTLGAPIRAAAPRVSGSLPSHYAPRARVELVAPDDVARRARELAGQGHQVAVLCRGGLALRLPTGIVAIPVSEDDAVLAQELYAALRRVDELGCNVALATMPLEQGIGVAIADRLRKAAAPRDGCVERSDRLD